MRSAAALTFILHNSALYNQLVGGLWGGQMRTHRFIVPHTRWLKACLKTDDVIRSYPCLSWISPMQHSTAMLNPCDDGASMSTREWQHFFQPEHKCLSIRRVYRLLNAAETGESTPAEEWVWEELSFSKTTTACQRAEIYPTINHCWFWSLLPAVNAARQQMSGRGGKDRLRTHVSALPPPQPPSSSFICKHSDKLRCFTNISAPSVFPDLPWILFCVAAPQLCF